MVNDHLVGKIQDLQQEFLRRLGQNQISIMSSPTPQLLRKIFDANHDLLEYALGDFGTRLGRYTRSIDIGHPDVITIFDGIFCDDQKFSKYCLELLRLAEFARGNGMIHVFPDIGNLFVREMVSKTVTKKLDGTYQTRAHVRLVRDQEERDYIRLNKRIQCIDLQAVYKKGEESWNSQPDNFKKFLRFDAAYEEEIKIAQKKMKRYQELGCNSLASEIEKSIELFKENMDQAYYGFNRITMTNAAIILAKSLGYTFIDSSIQIASSSTIKINRSFFGTYNFDVSRNGFAILNLGDDAFEYKPKVYPLYELIDIAPTGVLKTIQLLEQFPEANNRPIFDHYGIIVPSIQYNHESIYDYDGLIIRHNTIDEAGKALDKILIKRKYFYPIVVGEKDGKCFFICYWI